MIAQFFGEGQALSDQPRDTLSEGIVQSFDMIGFPGLFTDCTMTMAGNHLHGILVLVDQAGGDDVAGDEIAGADVALADMAMPCPYGRRFGEPIAGSLSTVARSFKSATTKYINRVRGVKGVPVWQGRFYEHIVRNGTSLAHIRRYVRNNPQVWYEDQLHPDNPSKW